VLPYVQDLVKNGLEGKKWGDVGDLENAGLQDLRKGEQGAWRKHVEEKLGPGDYQDLKQVDALSSIFIVSNHEQQT
jgi:hypothetical protein